MSSRITIFIFQHWILEILEHMTPGKFELYQLSGIFTTTDMLDSRRTENTEKREWNGATSWYMIFFINVYYFSSLMKKRSKFTKPCNYRGWGPLPQISVCGSQDHIEFSKDGEKPSTYKSLHFDLKYSKISTFVRLTVQSKLVYVWQMILHVIEILKNEECKA